MENIKNGGFYKDWKSDYENEYKNYKEILGELASHQAEVVGNEIRKRFVVFKGSDFSIKNPLK